jgi:O-antigen/teichoic acid export membrane protein
VILVVVAVAWIPLQSFNQLLPPVASDLYASGRMDTLNAVYTAVTRLILTTVVPILAVILVYGPELLGLFGPSYTQGYVPLLVYLGGVFVGSTVGATGWLLILTDHQYARMVLDWLLAVLNLGLTYAFVVQFGLVGAALGTSLAISVQNGIQVLLLRRFEGLWPFDRTFLRPIGAGVSMLAVMWTIRLTVPGWLGVLLGGIAGPVVYVSVLWAIGPDPRDRLVVSELATGYRTGLTDWFGR